jgi:hypothetical protein
MWLWARFKTPSDDFRPVKWKPPGPFWHTGYNSVDDSVIVAYVKDREQIKEYWPDAYEIDCEQRDEIRYSSRFQKPDWFQEDDTNE